MEEPPSTTPCLGLLLWVRPVYGDDAPEAWARLARKTVTTTKGWSEAYGLFLEGEAPMVLSYSTSPAYHMIAEDEDRYQAAGFAERSEEHTSELQSLMRISYAVFCLKNKK